MRRARRGPGPGSGRRARWPCPLGTRRRGPLPLAPPKHAPPPPWAGGLLDLAPDVTGDGGRRAPVCGARARVARGWRQRRVRRLLPGAIHVPPRGSSQRHPASHAQSCRSSFASKSSCSWVARLWACVAEGPRRERVTPRAHLIRLDTHRTQHAHPLRHWIGNRKTRRNISEIRCRGPPGPEETR